MYIRNIVKHEKTILQAKTMVALCWKFHWCFLKYVFIVLVCVIHCTCTFNFHILQFVFSLLNYFSYEQLARLMHSSGAALVSKCIFKHLSTRVCCCRIFLQIIDWE